MDNLIIESTKTTPRVILNSADGLFEISGESYPENALEFYKNIYGWLNSFLNETDEKVILTFNLTYFNTSSSKAILDIIDLMEKYYKQGKDMQIIWQHEEDDDDIADSGEEFKIGLSIPFHLQAI